MGQVAKLIDVIKKLAEFDTEDTIYAAEPWTELSKAMVAREPVGGGLPSEVSDACMRYFLEVAIALEFVEDWTASLQERPTPSAICHRVIEYAINDA
jgi:hypothetical protein